MKAGLSFVEDADCRGIVREKSDAKLFAIDDVGAAEDTVDVDAQPPKKRRRPLKADEILGTTDEKPKISSRISKSVTKGSRARSHVLLSGEGARMDTGKTFVAS